MSSDVHSVAKDLLFYARSGGVEIVYYTYHGILYELMTHTDWRPVGHISFRGSLAGAFRTCLPRTT
jgi:hypothetical protein